jgi:CBS domain-containing protein
MTEKNVVGMYNIKDQYPVFGYGNDDDEARVDAVDYSIAGPSAIAPIRGSIGGMDAVEQWRGFSEQLRQRRETAEKMHQHVDNSSTALQAPNQNRSPQQKKATPRQQDTQFQRSYEKDMVKLSSQSDVATWGLQKYLSEVQHPVPDEHLKTYETPEELHEEEAYDVDDLQVKDVMVRKVVCILESTTLEQVASICNRRGITGVPVVNQSKGLIGIITMSDITKEIFSQAAVSSFASQEGGEILEQQSLALLDLPVREFMHRKVITAPPETTVREACRMMMENNIRRLVIARGDMVKGIFSAKDAVRVLAGAELKVAKGTEEKAEKA